MRLLLVMALALTQVVTPPAAPTQGPKAPELTEIKKLQLDNAIQRVEITQLRIQQAQRDFEVARDAFLKMVADNKVEGYTLDLQTKTYKKDEPVKK